jgi:hypothetical protein
VVGLHLVDPPGVALSAWNQLSKCRR